MRSSVWSAAFGLACCFGLGCMPATHGCHRGRADGAFALLDLVATTVELGATIAQIADPPPPPPPREPPPRPVDRFPVYGRAVSREGGQPYVGVALALYRKGVWVDRTTTRADGTFSFPHLYAQGFYAILLEGQPSEPAVAFELDAGPYYRALAF